MKKARTLGWSAGVVAVAALVAVAIPGSPVYLPAVLAPGPRYQDKSAGQWAEGLNSPDPQARKQAMFALGALGPAAEESVPDLARIMLEDPDLEARLQASLALSKMAPVSRAAVPALARALEDSNAQVRMNAARALFQLREEARPAVPALAKALADKSNQAYVDPRLPLTVQQQVALTLGRATARTADGLPALTSALKGADADGMRISAARALGEVGPAARPAADDLRPLLQHENYNVREAAADALERIEGTRPTVAPPPPAPNLSDRPRGPNPPAKPPG